MPKLLINSLPKSGTHLVNKLLDHMGYEFSGAGFSSASLYGRHTLVKYVLRGILVGQPCVEVGLDVAACVRQSWVEGFLSKLKTGTYCGGHLPYSDCMHCLLSHSGIKVIHILRDPRDVLLSWAHYVPETKWHYGKAGLLDCSLDERVGRILSGYQSGPFIIESFPSILNRSFGWVNKDQVLAVRFEDLVGSKGGGSDQSQLESIQQVAGFLGIEVIDASNIAEGLFGGTKVFRKGRIGSWKDEISMEQVASINEVLREPIVEMGYSI